MAQWTASATNSLYGIDFRVWEESTSTTDNTSVVRYELYATAGNTWCTSRQLTRTVTINGTELVNRTDAFTISSNSSVLLESGTATINHESDGTKTISCSASIASSGTWSQPLGEASVSGSLTLTTIARASKPTLSASSIVCNGTNQITIYTNRKSSSFTHTISYSFFSASGTIGTAQAVTTSVTWKPAVTLLNQIPNATEGSCTITCKTYNGSTLIGTETVTLSITTTAANSGPTYTYAIAETGVTDKGIGASEVVALLSKKKVTITPAAKHGASITSVTITNGTQTKNLTASPYEHTFSSLTSGKFTVIVTDSRGFTSSADHTGTFQPYFKPTIESFAVERTSATASTGTATAAGKFFNTKIGTATANLTVSLKRGSTTISSVTATKSGNNYTINKTGLTGLTYTSSFTFTLTITDHMGQTATKKYVLGASQSALWIGKNTVRVDKYLIVEEDLKVNGSTLADIIAAAITENNKKIYPVGSIWISVSSTTSPATVLGFGTWARIENRFLYAVSGTSGGGDTGGASTVTLTKANLPKDVITAQTADVGYFTSQSSGWGMPNWEKTTATPTAVSTMPPYVKVYAWKRTA